MHVLSLPPISHSQIYVSGDVTIDESAAIAPGAILHAAPNSRIIVEAGACIGMGVILKAYQGTIHIATGASLGAGVLFVGQGKVGSYACLGAATTVLNASVEPRQVVQPGTVLGDASRQVEFTSESKAPPAPTPQPTADAASSAEDATPDTGDPQADSAPNEPAAQASDGTCIYGQTYVERLMVTLFPYKQSLDSAHQNHNNHHPNNGSS